MGVRNSKKWGGERLLRSQKRKGRYAGYVTSCKETVDTCQLICFTVYMWIGSFLFDFLILFSAFCNLIGTAVTDRCRMNGNLTDGIPGTQTVCSIIKLLDPLDSIFEMTSYWKRTSNQPEPFSSRGPRVTTLMLSPSLCRLHALLSFSLNWLDTKMQQFLASWSLAQFLLLMQWDLPIILESVKKTFSLIQLLCVHDDSTNWNSLSLHYHHLQEQRNKLEVGTCTCIVLGFSVKAWSSILAKSELMNSL